jgi:hypothetical protein
MEEDACRKGVEGPEKMKASYLRILMIVLLLFLITTQVIEAIPEQRAPTIDYFYSWYLWTNPSACGEHDCPRYEGTYVDNGVLDPAIPIRQEMLSMNMPIAGDIKCVDQNTGDTLITSTIQGLYVLDGAQRRSLPSVFSIDSTRGEQVNLTGVI